MGLSGTIWYYINTAVQALPDETADSLVKQRVDNLGNIFRFMDRLVPLIFIGLWAVVLFLSIRFEPSHPIFYIIGLLSLIFFSVIAVVLVDFGTLFFSNSVFDVVKDILSNSLFFVYNMHYISFIIGIISLIIFYSRVNISKVNEAGIQ